MDGLTAAFLVLAVIAVWAVLRRSKTRREGIRTNQGRTLVEVVVEDEEVLRDLARAEMRIEELERRQK